MSSFASLGAAREQGLVRANTATFLKARLEALVKSGVLDATALETLSRPSVAAGVPTRVITKRPEFVYKHVKSAVPGAC